MKFFNFKRFKKDDVSDRVYQSIHELPMNNWKAINQDGTLNPLLRDKKFIATKEELDKAWDVVFWEFVGAFPPQKMIEILRKQRDIEVLKNGLVLENKRQNQTLIEIKEFQLKQLLETKEEAKVVHGDPTLVYISKRIGCWPDLNKMTVWDYYSIIELMKTEAKQQKAAHSKHKLAKEDE